MDTETTTTPAPSAQADADVRLPFEAHAKAKKTPAWLLAAVKAYHRWANGAEMTAAEFTAAVSAVLNEPFGYSVGKVG